MKCERVGCGETENRIDGYCSVYCRDVADARGEQREECADILQEAIYRGELGVIAAHKARKVIEAVRRGKE